jgi:peptide alpha-N-acetyltransferase
MRDKINLQLFLRKYSQAAESRANLLRLQPRLRYSWTALAVAHHLAGDLQGASEMLDSYSELLDNIPSNDVEYSEVVLYKLEILLEANKAQAAQEVLDKEGKRIVDQEAKKQYSAAVLKKLGKTKAAELAYGDLLQDNSDNETYLNEYLLCRDVNVGG